MQAALQSAVTTYAEESGAGGNTSLAKTVTYRPGTNTLGIIAFCLAFGTVLGSLGPSGRPLVSLFGTIDQVGVMVIIMAINHQGDHADGAPDHVAVTGRHRQRDRSQDTGRGEPYSVRGEPEGCSMTVPPG